MERKDAVLEVERLASPLSPEAPTGKNLRLTEGGQSTYWRLRSAVRTARGQDRQTAVADTPDRSGLEAESESPRNQWVAVLDLSSKILADESKDLEVASLLLEAAVEIHGFRGLRDGCHLLRVLVKRFWPQLHPNGEGGAEVGEEAERLATLDSLIGTKDRPGRLVTAISSVPLTDAGLGERFAHWHHQRVEALEAITDPVRRASRIRQNGAVTRESFRSAARSSPEGFGSDLARVLSDCQEELESLSGILSEKEEESNVEPLSIELLQERCRMCEELVYDYFPQVVEDTAVSNADENERDQDRGTPPGKKVGANVEDGPIGRPALADLPSRAPVDREEAFRMLSRIADFFGKHEPHSPLSSYLQRAVRWGRMPLKDLFDELIRESGARRGVFDLIGIDSTSQEAGTGSKEKSSAGGQIDRREDSEAKRPEEVEAESGEAKPARPGYLAFHDMEPRARNTSERTKDAKRS